MPTNIDSVRKFLNNIRSIGFWNRLFAWRSIKDQLVDATADLERLLTNSANMEERIARADASLKAEQEAGNRLANKNDLLSQKNDQLTAELASTRNILVQLQTDEEGRRKGQVEQLATLKQIQEKIQEDREQEINARHSAEIAKFEKMKQTWIDHQESVKQSMKTLCNKHTIEYIDKVPFKGEPDNTIAICGEFIVFDAKSPRGDDLTNFPIYLKEQSEKARKYANEENVKKWIFFVVPTNTLEALKTSIFHLADYQVFVVTIDALEPIILSLKKVEEYEFADQLNPEDRESICRVLGKFAHLSKRRIQIDTYFINQFMELAYKCENDLPPDILERAIEFEKAEKLNPPQEKRAKTISLGELEKSITKVRNDAGNKGISVDDIKLTAGLNEVPLYKIE